MTAQNRRSRRPILSSRARGIVVSILCLLIVQWVEYQGWFSLINGRILSAILRNHATAAESPASKHVFVVDIDDKAYRDCFQGTSPMSPDGVMQIVDAVADANPKAIGVDIMTEDPKYRNHIAKLHEYASSIVWISENQVDTPPEVASFPAWLLGGSDVETISPACVLGWPPFQVPGSRQTNWGVPIYPHDTDGNVRRFPRKVQIAATDTQSGGIVPSFASRVGDVYCQPQCSAESADEVYISYAVKKPERYRLEDLFTCSSDGAAHDIVMKQSRHESFADTVRGGIVLIGGTFEQSLDFYQTPLNSRLPGLFVNAYAIKAQLDGNGFVELRQPLSWMLDLLLGILIVFVCDEQVLKRFSQSSDRYMPGFLRGWKRKHIIFSSAVVLLFCIGSLFLSHGRYLLGFAGEGAGVMLDRMRNVWEFSASEEMSD